MEETRKIRIEGNFYSEDGKTFYQYNAGNPDKSFTLPSSVKVIDKYAFHSCISLEHIRLPNGLKEIRRCAFRDCYRLKSIRIPSSVKLIGEEAFHDCWDLQKIEVDKENKNYKSIGGKLYSKNGKTLLFYPMDKKVKTFTFPKTVKEIGEGVFSECKSIELIKIPSSIKTIGEKAFCKCKNLESIFFNEGLKEIGQDAFYGCEKLKTVTFPEGLEKIGDGAFEYCKSLESICIPASVKEIGKDAFGDYRSITKIEVSRKNQFYKKVKGNIYTKDGKTLVRFLNQAATNFTLPNTVKEIGEGSFSGCSTLMALEIPESVEVIRKGAFSECLNLKKVKLSNGLKKIECNAFQKCKSLLEIEIPSSVELLERNAFDSLYLNTIKIDRENKIYKNIDGNIYTDKGKTLFCFLARSSSFTVPDCVRKIEEEAFSYNKTLKSVYISSSVKLICQKAFYSCSSLVRVTLSEGLKEIGETSFALCSSLKEIYIPEGVKKIGKSAFFECTKLNRVSLPKNLKEIENGAFRDCHALTFIEIPSSVESIGSYAFFRCPSLETVYLHEGLREIKNIAFRDCSLDFIKIPSTVESIGKDSLSCKTLREIDVDKENRNYQSIEGSLYTKDGKTLILFPGNSPSKSFVIPDSVTSIEENAFKDCWSLKCVKFPKSIKQIGRGTFSYCENLSNVVFSEGLKKIEGEAFSCCGSLKRVKIPRSVTHIDNEAFWGCINLERIDRVKPGEDLSIDETEGENEEGQEIEKKTKVSKEEVEKFNAWVKKETKRLSRVYSFHELENILSKKLYKYEEMFHDMPPTWRIYFGNNHDIAKILAIVDGAIKRGISWWLLTGYDRTYQYGEILW